jgi:uncharacterized protein
MVLLMLTKISAFFRRSLRFDFCAVLLLGSIAYSSSSYSSEQKDFQIPAPPPEILDFSIEEFEVLAKQELAVKRRWDEYQLKMNQAFLRIVKFGGRNVGATATEMAWEKFLGVFAADNPYSLLDDRLIKVVTERSSTDLTALLELAREINGARKFPSASTSLMGEAIAESEVSISHHINDAAEIELVGVLGAGGNGEMTDVTDAVSPLDSEKRDRLLLEEGVIGKDVNGSYYSLVDENCVFKLEVCRLALEFEEENSIIESIWAKTAKTQLKVNKKKGSDEAWTKTFELGDRNSRSFAGLDIHDSGKLIAFYPDDRVALEGPVANGTMNGVFTYYYEQGQKAVEGRFRNGSPDGRFREWYPNGETKTEAKYLRGFLSGGFKSWFESGQLKTTATLKAGKYTGKVKEYYRNGQLRSTGWYDLGRLSGPYKEWYPGGSIALDQRPRTGVVPTNWRENQIMYSGRARGNFFRSDDRSVVSTKRSLVELTKYGSQFFKNGQKRSEAKNGRYSRWRESGSLEITFNKGVETHYYDNGQPNLIRRWSRSGVASGEWEAYYPSGQIRQKTLFQDGKREGRLEIFHENGIPASSGQYRNNLKDGLWVGYNYMGDAAEKVCFKAGALVEDGCSN